MKISRFSEPQILAILRQAEGGVLLPGLCREHGMSHATFYKWRSKYGGINEAHIASTGEQIDYVSLGHTQRIQ